MGEKFRTKPLRMFLSVINLEKSGHWRVCNITGRMYLNVSMYLTVS